MQVSRSVFWQVMGAISVSLHSLHKVTMPDGQIYEACVGGGGGEISTTDLVSWTGRSRLLATTYYFLCVLSWQKILSASLTRWLDALSES